MDDVTSVVSRKMIKEVLAETDDSSIVRKLGEMPIFKLESESKPMVMNRTCQSDVELREKVDYLIAATCAVLGIGITAGLCILLI